ncbi:hypothetical protein ZOSMA_121G00020 [Zostera marina]|uniref:Uncharacterized protein n=1 Tax=Zostera marina TaxID=29655 RepID=A0A0K9Q0Z4_ZOSMR|nr:hypothetical protein ZOSMA_121G00020 [Zostera marina]
MAAEGEESEEPMKYQKWVLKVSIYCKGCKKKVKTVLQNIEVEVNSDQNKVIVTGDINIDAEVLIRKLVKSGKYAELWPEKPKSKEGKGKVIMMSPEEEEKKKNSGQDSQNPGKCNSDEKIEEKEKPKSGGKNEEKPNCGEGKLSEKKLNYSDSGTEMAGDEKKKASIKTAFRIFASGDNSKGGPHDKAENNTGNTTDSSCGKKEKEAQIVGICDDNNINAIGNHHWRRLLEEHPPYRSIPTYPIGYTIMQPSYKYCVDASPEGKNFHSNPELPPSATMVGLSLPPPCFYPYYQLPIIEVGSVTLPSSNIESYDVFSDENPNACRLM